jgi:DNA-binding transcriptional MerR regulator
VEFGFTARQVVHLTGVPYSTLNLWAKNGLVQPSVAPGTGTGSERVYSFSDLVTLKVAFELRKAGVTTSSLKKVIQFLRENEGLDKPLVNARLVVSGRDVLVVRNSNELVSALSKPGQSCLSFVLDLPRTVGELTEIADATRAFATGFATAERDLKRPPKKAAAICRRKRA